MARLHISVAENSNHRNQEVKDFNSLIQVYKNSHESFTPENIQKWHANMAFCSFQYHFQVQDGA